MKSSKYERLKAEGKCIRCAGDNDNSKGVRCEACTKIHNKVARDSARRRYREENGLPVDDDRDMRKKRVTIHD